MGLGGLHAEEGGGGGDGALGGRQGEVMCVPAEATSYLLAPMGSQLPLLLILRVALPCLQAMVCSVRLAVNSRSSCALERFCREMDTMRP